MSVSRRSLGYPVLTDSGNNTSANVSSVLRKQASGTRRRGPQRPLSESSSSTSSLWWISLSSPDPSLHTGSYHRVLRLTPYEYVRVGHPGPSPSQNGPRRTGVRDSWQTDQQERQPPSTGNPTRPSRATSSCCSIYFPFQPSLSASLSPSLVPDGLGLRNFFLF